MTQDCKYDPKKDIAEVDQFGFVDLNESIANGFVPNDLGSVSNEFDGTDVDPESIIRKPKDTFEAIRMQEKLAEGVVKSNKKSVKSRSELNQRSDPADNE